MAANESIASEAEIPSVTSLTAAHTSRRGLTPVWILVGIIILSTLIDLFFFTGFYSSDDIGYFSLSRYILSHGHLPQHTQFSDASFRLVLLSWNMCIIWLFGAHVQLVAGSYIVFHQILNVLTYLLAAMLCGRRVGLVAAYLTALCPLLITFSSTIIPDVAMTCLFLFSLYAFVRAYDPQRHTKTAASLLWMFVAGAAVIGSYMAKESGLVLLPFYFFLWLAFSRGRRVRTVLMIGTMFVLGLACMFVLEWGLLSYLTGHSYIRLNSAIEKMDAASRSHIMRYGTNPLERLEWVGRRLNESFDYVPLVVAIFILLLIASYPFFRRSRWPVFLLPLWVFVYQTWGSMRWNEYFPPSIKIRYYAPIMPFVAIILAFVLVTLFRCLAQKTQPTPLRRCIEGLAVALIIVVPLSGLDAADEDAGRLYRAEEVGGAMAAIRFALNQRQDEPIVLSAYMSHRLQVFFIDQRPEQIMYSTDLGKDQLIQMLEAGGFYFVDAPGRYKPGMPCSELDSLMHWFGGERITASAVKSTAFQASPLFSAASSGVGRFQMPGYEGYVREIGWFHPQKKRSAEARVLLGHGLVHKRDLEKLRSRAVWLCHVTARHTPSEADTNRVDANLRVRDLVGSSAGWRTMYPKRFRSGEKTDGEKPIKRIDRKDAGPRLVLNLWEDGYLWLVPDMAKQLELWTLDSDGPHEIVIEVGVKGDVKSELRLDIYKDRERKKLLSGKRIILSGVPIHFEINTGGNPLYVKPAFKISGTGEFSLDRFVVRSPASESP